MVQKLISIVVPMYFEEKVAEECYKRLLSVVKENQINYEFIFVNDGSTDSTLEILEDISKRDHNVKVISLSRNFGHQIAVTAGIEKARGEALVIIDADLQDPPELIPDMISLWEKGYDIVYGKRKKREGESWFKLATAKLFYRVLNKLSSVKIPIDAGDFRLIDRKAAEALKKMPEHNRFLRGMNSWIGFKQIALEYERKERYAGETKYPLKKMLKLAMDGIFSFSSKPLKFIEYLGFGAVIISLILVLFSAARSIFAIKEYNANPILMFSAIAFIGGIQLLSIGIVGEYIARIYDETRGRPLYIIDREINLDEGVVKPLYVVDTAPEVKETQKEAVGSQ